MVKKLDQRVGAHLSTTGGIDKAIERAHKMGANCLQVFSGSPRMWRRTPLERIDTEKIFAKQRELGVSPIFTHALYLVNLASDKPELVEKSVNALKHDLQFDSFVKGAGVVVHLGSHQGRGWEAVREQIRDRIVEILQNTSQDSKFLIENSAGQKGKLCSDLGEIRWLLDEIVKKDASLENRLGWCFDTCHGFAAGYALGGVNGVLEEMKKYLLLDKLYCIHVNDSRDPFGSGRDRHDNIGEGTIPAKDLKYFLQAESVKTIPLITEAPGFDKGGPDAENISRIKELMRE